MEISKKHIPRRQTMPVHTLIPAVRTRPEPAVLPLLHGRDEILAHFVCCRLRIPVSTQHHFPQLLLIPIIHLIFLQILLPLRLLLLPRILVQIPLRALPLNIQIMREFTLLPLFALSLLEKLAQHRLGVHPKRHLLDLHRFEEFGCFEARLLGGVLLFFFGFFFGFFALFIRGFVGLCLGF
jgi:hypothetical protein